MSGYARRRFLRLILQGERQEAEQKQTMRGRRGKQQPSDESSATNVLKAHDCILSLSVRRVLALEIAGVLAVTVPVVLRVFWISAEWAAAAWERGAGGNHGIGRRPLLNPVDNSGKHVEVIESGPATAVGHAGDEEHSAPFGNLFSAAVGCGK